MIADSVTIFFTVASTVMRRLILTLLSALCFATAARAQDQTNAASILILDASGSMWGQLEEGRSRIEVAREVLDDFLRVRQASAPLGVVAYGHNRRGDCSDISVVAPLGEQDPRLLASRLRAISPKGKTPIADALRLAAAQVPPTAEDADLVLITDGLETCGGDPCAVAAELARSGIPMRAHVVGFGLTESEVKQIACVAEETGGMVLVTQSGSELAEALVQTTTATRPVETDPGFARVNLTIAADIAGRPDRVTLRGVHEATDETVEFGVLDFTQDAALAVDLAEGNWLLTADSGDLGNGELAVAIEAGDHRTIYIPFRGLLPTLDLVPPIGAMRAGASGIFPLSIRNEGLAVGGADFQLTLLPADTTALDDRPITWSAQDGRLGAYVSRLNMPAEPGQYLVAYHRYGETDLSQALAVFPLELAQRPEVTLVAPEAVEPGSVVPATVIGGLAHADRLEIWKDGQLYSWDQSRYMETLFPSVYGPATLLYAPAEPGDYELVYVFSDIDGPDGIAARQPLRVGDATFDDAAAATGASAPRCDDNTGCGMGEDAGPGVFPVRLIADDPQGRPVEWFVQPVDVPDGQAVGSGEPVEGAWDTALDAGLWAVTGIAENATYFMQITVSQTGASEFILTADAPVDVAPTAQNFTFVCEDPFQCVYENADVGIITILPAGWAVDQPTRAAINAGAGDGLLRVNLFDTADTSQSMALNPHQWIEMNGPCLDVQPGQLCFFEPATDATLTALELVRRSIRDTQPSQSASPAAALADVLSNIARQDPAAAEAMRGLLDAASGDGAAAVPDLGALLSDAMGNAASARATVLPTPDTALTADQFDSLRQQLTGN